MLFMMAVSPQQPERTTVFYMETLLCSVKTEARDSDGKFRALQTIPIKMGEGGQGRLTRERK